MEVMVGKKMMMRREIMKVLPSALPRVTSQSSSLRGTTDACMIVNMHGSVSAGKLWVVHGSDDCYGTN